jgi:hypothetical protein
MPRKIEVQIPERATEQVPTREPPEAKPKREITEAQREHLNKIRQLALEKKKQLKEITLKAKLAKSVPKEDLARQYDDYVTQKAQQQQPMAYDPHKGGLPPPQKPKKFKKRFDNSESETDVTESEEEEVIIKKKTTKPVKKIKKKIVYESESESEEEQIVVRKKSTHKPEKLEKLVYKNTQEQLYQHMIEERVKNSLMGYSNALGV